MKKQKRVPSLSPLASRCLQYGLFAVICHAAFLWLYHDYSVLCPARLPRLTPSELSYAMEHLLMSLFLLSVGAFLIDRAERYLSSEAPPDQG